MKLKILDHSFDSFWLLALDDYSLIYANKNPTEKLLGYPVEKFYQDPLFWLSLVHEVDKPIAIKLTQDCLDTNKASAEYRMKRADGSTIWVLVRATLIIEEDGESKFILGHSTDISERFPAKRP